MIKIAPLPPDWGLLSSLNCFESSGSRIGQDEAGGHDECLRRMETEKPHLGHPETMAAHPPRRHQLRGYAMPTPLLSSLPTLRPPPCRIAQAWFRGLFRIPYLPTIHLRGFCLGTWETLHQWLSSRPEQKRRNPPTCAHPSCGSGCSLPFQQAFRFHHQPAQPSKHGEQVAVGWDASHSALLN